MNRPLRQPLSLTTRLALLFALFAVLLLLLAGVLLERAVAVHFRELDEHELASKLAVIENLAGRTASEEALAALPRRLEDALFAHKALEVQVSDPQGKLLHASPGNALADWPTGTRSAGRTQAWEHGGVHYIGRAATFQAPLPEPLTLHAQVAIDTSHHQSFLQTIRLQLLAGILATAVLAAGLGWLAAHKGLAPLRRVTQAARRLSADRLDQRLSERDAPAEILDLLRAFNGMLERLEAAFRRLGEFSADIAHELRTPVSNLMTETQVALSRTRSAEEYRDILHSNLEEFERLARMIGDMLFLAKADNGHLPQPAEAVVLETEARALLEFYEALAEEKGVELELAGSGTVVGDRLMLRRAVSNLLSNALRHTERGLSIGIRIDRVGGQVRLEVRNPGTTIPTDRLPLLFDRFHRVDTSRSSQGEGAGLGLAITRSIVEAHGGHIEVVSEDGVTTFSIFLPDADMARSPHRMAR